MEVVSARIKVVPAQRSVKEYMRAQMMEGFAYTSLALAVAYDDDVQRYLIIG